MYGLRYSVFRLSSQALSTRCAGRMLVMGFSGAQALPRADGCCCTALRAISSMLLGHGLSAPLAALSFCALGLLIGAEWGVGTDAMSAT